MDAIVSPQRSLIDLNDDDDEDDDDSKSNSPQPTTTAKLIDISMPGVDVTDNGPPQTNSGYNADGNPSASAAATTESLQQSVASAIVASNTGASPKIRALSSQQQQQNRIHTPKKLPLLTCTSMDTNGTLTATTTNVNLPNNAIISKSRWNPPMLSPLPAGFLRVTTCPINNVSNTINLPYDPARGEFDLPDEQFAMMLQNEEFMNQLRWNQEFMNALDKEQCGGKAKSAEDDAAFKERLKHMGKVSRKKFLQIARVFTWQRNKKVTMAKQIDSLPLKEEPSDDEDHHQHQNRQQQQQQSLCALQSGEQSGEGNLEQRDKQNQQQKYHSK